MPDDETETSSAEPRSDDLLERARQLSGADDERINQLVYTCLSAAASQRLALRGLMQEGHDFPEVDALEKRIRSMIDQLPIEEVAEIASKGGSGRGFLSRYIRQVEQARGAAQPSEPDYENSYLVKALAAQLREPGAGLSFTWSGHAEGPAPESQPTADDDAAMQELDSLIEDLERKLPTLPQGI